MTLDPSRFQRDDDGAWWAADDASLLEVRVSGQDAPDARALALATDALAHLDALLADAVHTLRAFLDPARYGPDEWSVEQLDVGVGPARGTDHAGRGELALGLAHAADTYGAWSVTFRVLLPSEAALLRRWATPTAFTRQAR